MPSGTFSKRIRYLSSITNRKNCGGNKKGGLVSRATGPTQYRNIAFNKKGINLKMHKSILPCPTNYSNNPGGQCSGGVGGLASNRNRGCKNLGRKITRQTITLDQALKQQRVYWFQDLVYAGPTTSITVDGLGDYSAGLIIDKPFTIEKFGTVTLTNNIDGGNKTATGILVTNGGILINNGTISLPNITADACANGIALVGTGVGYNNGKISFNDIITQFLPTGLYQNDSSKFTNRGIINFNGVIEATIENPTGFYYSCAIDLYKNSVLYNYGIITSKQLSAKYSNSLVLVVGLALHDSGKLVNEQKGIIQFDNFNGIINNFYAIGITGPNISIENNGIINFTDKNINYKWNPGSYPDDIVSGTGKITYDNGNQIFYPQQNRSHHKQRQFQQHRSIQHRFSLFQQKRLVQPRFVMKRSFQLKPRFPMKRRFMLYNQRRLR